MVILQNALYGKKYAQLMEFITCPLTAQFISETIEIEEIYGHTTNDKLVVNK
jgi:hypothetical protein